MLFFASSFFSMFLEKKQGVCLCLLFFHVPLKQKRFVVFSFHVPFVKGMVGRDVAGKGSRTLEESASRFNS